MNIERQNCEKVIKEKISPFLKKANTEWGYDFYEKTKNISDLTREEIAFLINKVFTTYEELATSLFCLYSSLNLEISKEEEKKENINTLPNSIWKRKTIIEELYNILNHISWLEWYLNEKPRKLIETLSKEEVRNIEKIKNKFRDNYLKSTLSSPRKWNKPISEIINTRNKMIHSEGLKDNVFSGCCVAFRDEKPNKYGQLKQPYSISDIWVYYFSHKENSEKSKSVCHPTTNNRNIHFNVYEVLWEIFPIIEQRLNLLMLSHNKN